MTVRVSVAVLPGPPSFELTAPDVLVKLPAAVPVTFTTTVQEPLVAMVPPVRLMLLPPAAADAVPLQVLLSPFGVATTRPNGSVSLNATPVNATPLFGFWMVNVNVLVAFSGMVFGLNALAMLGGLATVRVAVAAVPVPPFVELTAPVVFT